MQGDEQPREASSRWHSHCLADVLLCALVALGMAAWCWERYRADANPPLLSLSDIGLLIGLVAAPILSLLLIAVLACAVLRMVGWQRMGHALLGIGVWGYLFWYAADVRVHLMTGRRLAAFTPYFLQPDVGEWGGGTDQILAAAGTLAAMTLAITIGLLLYRHWLHGTMRRGGAWRYGMGWAIIVVVLTATVTARVYAKSIAAAPTELAKAIRLLNASAAEDQERLIARSPFGLAFSEAMRPVLEPMHDRLFVPAPLPAPPALPAGRPPDIVLIVLESWRADALDPRSMPRLSRLSQNGLTLRQHYAGSNRSEFGLFALLYGRSPGQYHQTLDRKIPPVLCHTVRAWGYRSLYISGLRHQGFNRMEQFIDAPGAFDEVSMLSGAEWHQAIEQSDWPQLDREALKDIQSRLQQENRQPLFATAFLGSTHLPYRYPVEFERNLPVCDTSEIWKKNISRETHELPLRNRYANALAYLDDEIGRFAESIDLSNTILIITGDHGESFWDDGTLAHASRPSDVQCRVPFVLLAPRKQPRVVQRPTMHQGVLATLEHLVVGDASSSGRSFWSDSSGQSILLTMVPPKPGPQEYVLIAGAERMQVRLMERQPVARFLGFSDAVGIVDPALTPPVELVPQWVEQWRAALDASVP